MNFSARQICAPALDKSAALRYIIRYKCSAKECARVVPLQQAGEDASPVRCGGCCHFQAGAVRGASPLPAAHGVAAVIRAGGLVGLPQSGPIGQLGWYRDLNFSGRPMIFFMGWPFLLITRPTILKEVLHNAERTRQTICPVGHRGPHLPELVRQGVFPYPDRPQQKAVYHRHAAAERHRPAAHGPRHG